MKERISTPKGLHMRQKDKLFDKASVKSDQNEENVFQNTKKIDVDRNTGQVVVWAENKGDGSTYTVKSDMQQQSEDSNYWIGKKVRSMGNVFKSDDQEDHTPGNQPDINVPQISVPEEVTRPTPKKRRKPQKGKYDINPPDSPQKNSFISKIDIDGIVNQVVQQSWGKAHEHIRVYLKNLFLLLLESMKLDNSNQFMEVVFKCDKYLEIVKPVAHDFSTLDQVTILQIFIIIFINIVESNETDIEYCRRALSLQYQFDQDIIRSQWTIISNILPECVAQIATILKVDEDWPLFPDADILRIENIERKMDSLNQTEKEDLEYIFLGQEHTNRLLIMRYFAEARINKYKFSFSHEELSKMTKEGFPIPLVLRIDLSLELSVENFKWNKISDIRKLKKMKDLYLAMNGICKTAKVHHQIIPVHWTFSPIHQLMKSQRSCSERFETRLQLLVSFGKLQNPVSYVDWVHIDSPEAWEKEILINGGEALAATRSGIELRYLAELKNWFMVRTSRSKLIRDLPKMRTKALKDNWSQKSNDVKMNPNPLRCWPKKQEDEAKLPPTISSQREKFAKYFQLLGIPIPNFKDSRN